MRARLPQIDFSSANALWLPVDPWVGHVLNGASILMPYLEPYLIRVMRRARPLVEEQAPQLLEDLDVFNRQEANHYRVHMAYNAVIHAQYPGLEPFEDEIRRDYEDFLAERSLAWNLAYCEGFECMGLMLSEFFLQEIDDWLAESDPAVSELWQWHLAEEFEHRSVAHDVLAALYPGWRSRLRGFFFCQRHLFGSSSRVAERMCAFDAEHDRRDTGREQKHRERAARMRMARFFLPRVGKLLLPGYDPNVRAMQEPTRARLASY